MLSVKDVPKPVFVLFVAVLLDPEGSTTVQVNEYVVNVVAFVTLSDRTT